MNTDVIETRFAELQALSQQYAEAHAQAEHLTEFRKSKKALLMKEAEALGVKTSAMQERDAYAHRDYIALLDGLKAATEKAQALKWRLELFKLKFDAWRTAEATKRAEMNLR